MFPWNGLNLSSRMHGHKQMSKLLAVHSGVGSCWSVLKAGETGSYKCNVKRGMHGPTSNWQENLEIKREIK